MDQIKTGNIIRTFRTQNQMTQKELADKLNISAKTVSKWECGGGLPDISLIPMIANILNIDTDILLEGNMEENDMINGNMKNIKFYVCPHCQNILFSAEKANISCCNTKLEALTPVKADEHNKLNTEIIDGELYISTEHEMLRDHYISFVAFLTGDTVIIKKHYPEWELHTRFPLYKHGLIVWYCTQHGLMYQNYIRK